MLVVVEVVVVVLEVVVEVVVVEVVVISSFFPYGPVTLIGTSEIGLLTVKFIISPG